MYKVAFIVRGISTTDKNNWIKKNLEHARICSTESDEKCLNDFILNLINNPYCPIVVDNPNALKDETYLKVAKAFGWTVQLVLILSNPYTVEKEFHISHKEKIHRMANDLLKPIPHVQNVIYPDKAVNIIVSPNQVILERPKSDKPSGKPY